MHFEQSYFEDEVKDGFYVPSEMKHAWAAQLEVLWDVDRVCQKHHIEYFLSWGSLLGAVRHHGFIPWDDDLDICMKRPDFQRFMEIAKEELPENYVVEKDIFLENGINLVCRINNAQRIRNDADFLEKYHEFPYVAGLDVFPMDYLAPDEESDKKQMELLDQLVAAMIIFHKTKTCNFPEMEMRLRYIEDLSREKIKRDATAGEQLSRLWTKTCGMYGEKDSDYLTSMDLWKNGHRFRMPKEYFSNSVRIPFENMRVPVPVGYDALLKYMFGDYMSCVRTWDNHNYPFYKIQQEMLKKSDGICRRRYVYSKEATKRAAVTSKWAQLIRNYQSILLEAHQEIGRGIEAGRADLVFALLENCQKLAVQLGTALEGQYGETDERIRALEKYCDMVFSFAEQLQGECDVAGHLNKLDEQIQSLKAKKIVLFLPIHAKQWKTMEPLWRKYQKEEETEVYVIPIPYFYRNIEGEFLSLEYEGEAFLPEIPITHYEAFDIKNTLPDMIITQNTYDEYNPAMSVHPYFYTANLRNYCGKLIYVSPFWMDDFDESDGRAWEHIHEYVTVPGVVLADEVVVCSEQIRSQYIKALTSFAGEDTRFIWEEKIVPMDKEWNATGEKNTIRKQILYYNSYSVLQEYGMKAMEKLKQVFAVFEKNREDFHVIWLQDPMIEENQRKLPPTLWKEYEIWRAEMKSRTWIMTEQDIAEEDAINCCCAYYGDASILAHKCERKKKPIMIQDVKVRN